LEAGAPQEAVALVVENDNDRWMNREWLAKYYRTHGTPQGGCFRGVGLLYSWGICRVRATPKPTE
jgi:hypothetical protein